VKLLHRSIAMGAPHSPTPVLMIIAASSHWRAGSTLIGLSIAAGGLFRLLPQRRVGLLAVRNRIVDTLVLLIIGVGITVLAWAVPALRN